MFMNYVQQAQMRGETMVHFHLDTNSRRSSTMAASTQEAQYALAAAMADAAEE